MLITKLRENREKHECEYNEALRGFEKKREKKISDLADAVGLANEVKTVENRKAIHVAYRALTGLDRPVSQVESYTKATTVMEWIETDKVKLSMNDFQCYVEDDWSWKDRFRATVANYSNA